MTDENNEFLAYFPFESIRKNQRDFVNDFSSALKNKQNFICHAPTGIGKTAAVLAPAVWYAKEHEKTIIFLTSRHTQHRIALETLQKMKEKNVKIKVTDIVGRKWMCSQPNIDALSSGEFYEFCKSLREGDKCEFFLNTKSKNKLTPEAKNTINEMKNAVQDTEELTKTCQRSKLCPYELALSLASKSDVVIADYYYMFHPSISKLFLTKTNKELEDCIIIVDEAHNLPPRLRELATDRLSTLNISRAIKEARRFGFNNYIEFLNHIDNVLKRRAESISFGNEKIIGKQDFIREINEQIEYSQLAEDLEEAAEEVREKQRQSYLGGVSSFLHNWSNQPEDGFARIISKDRGRDNEIVTLSNNCLDPSVISREVIEKSAATVLMSGTLNPPVMYRDILGFNESVLKTYPSPFPKENRLNLIVPKTTTKYNKRSESMFAEIAQECAKVANNVPGNTIVFFPSYYIRDRVNEIFHKISEKTVFYEQPNMSIAERDGILERFKQYKKIGSVLLAVVSGSFYEGVDLPGDLLKSVVIVGLPFQQPDLKTKELIGYYDKKYRRGWDYGYVYPAFNKTLQSAGRCIRSENDRGIVVFLDERYAWGNYKKIFPEDLEVEIVNDPSTKIRNFFRAHPE